MPMVSIHAPHAGRDGAVARVEDVEIVSIHAPHAGRDAALTENTPAKHVFQSTRPTRGATWGPRCER